MSKIRVPSQQTYNDIAAMKRKVLGSGPAIPPPPKPSQLESVWYWGELVDDLDAPTDSWTDPAVGYCKLMAPDPADDSDPREFVEIGTGAVTGATNANPIVITSTAHKLRVGEYVYIKGVLGNTNANGYHAVTVVTANAFTIAATGNGAYTSGGNWYRAVKFVNRSADLQATDGTLCKVEFAWGEWSLKWIDC